VVSDRFSASQAPVEINESGQNRHFGAVPDPRPFFYRPKKRAIGYCTIGPGTLVHMPEAALAIIPGAHVLRALRDYALAFGTRQRRLESGDDTRGDVVLHCEVD